MPSRPLPNVRSLTPIKSGQALPFPDNRRPLRTLIRDGNRKKLKCLSLGGRQDCLGIGPSSVEARLSGANRVDDRDDRIGHEP